MQAAAQERPWAFVHAVELYQRGAEFTEIAPALLQARADVERLTEMAVQRAAGRETWSTIGTSLGVTRQAARKKYGPA